MSYKPHRPFGMDQTISGDAFRLTDTIRHIPDASHTQIKQDKQDFHLTEKADKASKKI